MASKRRRPSLIAALLWVGLGTLFLLYNFGVGPNVWSVAARYWPILLILLGIGKVIDYYRHKEGVSIRIGEVFAILFLVVVGSAVTKFWESGAAEAFRSMPIRIGNTSVRPGQWFGTSFRYTDEARYAVAASTPLKIQNSYGNVSLLPGNEGEVRVRLTKVVYDSDEAHAKRIASEIKLEGGPEGGAEAAAFLVRTNRESLASKDYRFNTEMEISLPPNAQVQVRNSFGEVRAASLGGKLDVSTSHNSLEVRDFTGELIASNRFAESRLLNITGNVQLDARGRVYIETVKGNVDVRNEYSPTEVTDVQGTVNVVGTEGRIEVSKATKAVVIEGRGSDVVASQLGETLKVSASHRRIQVTDVASDVALSSEYSTVNIKEVRGSLTVTSNSDRVTAHRIGGGLTVRGQGTQVNANEVNGAVEIASTLKDVVVNDFAGGCRVTNEFGDVSISTARLGKDDVVVKNRNASIEVNLPKDAGFVVDATARNGHIDTDFPSLQPQQGPGDSWILKAKAGAGGPRIQLETEYSNISVRERDTEVEQQDQPRRRARAI